MKTERTILAAFLLNCVFSLLEFFGGMMIGSTAIVSDAVHDAGDAVGIGIAYALEKKSKRQPDERYTYGYTRYSLIGGWITSGLLFLGSLITIANAVRRLITPTDIRYDGMIVFAVLGMAVNVAAVLFTRKGESVNQKAVSLHMLEDVLGWGVVFIGAVVMRFTNLVWIDPLMAIGVSVVMLVCAAKTLKEVAELLLEKAPQDIGVCDVKRRVCAVDGVQDVHHVHLWSMDGRHHFATMHVVTEQDPHMVKEGIRRALQECGVCHVTIEIETEHELCCDLACQKLSTAHGIHNHAHHHH